MKTITKNFIRSFLLIIFILTLFAGLQAQTKKTKHTWNWQKHQTEVINYAKKYLVSEIEPNVPPLTFADWFQQTVGEESKVEWDINDCGEQTGTSADRGRDFPMCVTANTVKAGFIYIGVNIQVGSFKRGITKMKPVVRSITAGDEIGGEWLDNLSELPKILALHEKTPEHLNPNIGVFKATGKLPQEFEKIEGMWVKTMDYDPQGKYVWVTATGGLIVGPIMYEFQSVLIDGKTWFFETIKIDGVSFKFEGQFAKLKFDSNGAILGDNSLQGHLTKFVNGKKAAEADLNFNFVITEHPDQNLKISEIKKLNPTTGVFTTSGFIISNRPCPPCPPKTVCKPCENRILISEENKPSAQNITEKEMIIRTENPEKFVKGKEYIFKIRITARNSTGDSLNNVEIISYKIIQ